MKSRPLTIVCGLVTGLWAGPWSAMAQDKKPNILIIWGDDIGYWNILLVEFGADQHRSQ